MDLEVRLSCGLLLFLAMASSALADTIHLRDGRTIKGKIVERTADAVKVIVETRNGDATLTFKPADIDSIESNLTPREEYAERSKKADPSDFQQQLDLAEWCVTNRLEQFAAERFIAASTLRSDDQRPIKALRAMTYHRVKLKWLNEGEFMRALGYEREGNEWLHPAERGYRVALTQLMEAEATLAGAKTRESDASSRLIKAKADVDRLQHLAELGPRAVSDAKGAVDLAERFVRECKQAVRDAEGVVRERDRDLSEANSQVTSLRAAYETENAKAIRGEPNDAARIADDLKRARKRAETSKAAVERAEASLSRAEITVTSAETRVDSAKADLARIQAEVDTVAVRLPRLREDLPALEKSYRSAIKEAESAEPLVPPLRVVVDREKQSAAEEIERIRKATEDEYK